MFNLMHLRYFFDAARLGSITASATANHVGQSTVSQAIKTLELDLGVKLTCHKRNRFNLTWDGKRVFRHASMILKGIKEMQHELTSDDHEVVGELSFVCVNSLATNLIPGIYQSLSKKHPRLKINFHRGGRKFIKQSIIDRSVEFGLVLEDPMFSEFDIYPLKEGEFRIFSADKLSPKDLKHGILVDDVSSIEVRRFMDCCDQIFGFQPPILKELSSWTLVERFALEKVGAALLPDYFQTSLVPLKLPFKFSNYKICAAHFQGEQPSSSALALHEHVLMGK